MAVLLAGSTHRVFKENYYHAEEQIKRLKKEKAELATQVADLKEQSRAKQEELGSYNAAYRRNLR